jgi:alpha-amylase/alpha-mannosidase (GH57 family)
MSQGARRSVVIHAHFYQPPREEPWLELVEAEPSAAPFHDWNRRIERECYRAVVAARIPAADGRIERVVNTLERISFNVGPTLVEWLEREAPETWNAMLEADRTSRLRLGGHGNALAMPYHHVILPLASRRDKTTEVRWGIADFRRRFGRDPEGMWLPETAVDDETLDVLAAEGIRFTILAPHQVDKAPPAGFPAGTGRSTGGRSPSFCTTVPSRTMSPSDRWYATGVAGRRPSEAGCPPRRPQVWCRSRPTVRPTVTITGLAKWRSPPRSIASARSRTPASRTSRRSSRSILRPTR